MIYKLAIQDAARNYFVCQTLIKSENIYENVWISDDESAAVLKRRSGNVQVIIDDSKRSIGVYTKVYQHLLEMDWKSVIAASAIKDALIELGLQVVVRPGSLIARCTPERWNTHDVDYEGEMLGVQDIPEVVSLYERVFKGFSSSDYMTEKIKSGRGRGYIVRDGGTLMGVAQTDFETDGFALIVGVASNPSCRRMGYGESVFKHLGDMLIAEGKTIDLIYENPIAGTLYEKYGFKVYDQNYHLERILT